MNQQHKRTLNELARRESKIKSRSETEMRAVIRHLEIIQQKHINYILGAE